jgi:hypothetical protein
MIMSSSRQGRHRIFYRKICSGLASVIWTEGRCCEDYCYQTFVKIALAVSNRFVLWNGKKPRDVEAHQSSSFQPLHRINQAASPLLWVLVCRAFQSSILPSSTKENIREKGCIRAALVRNGENIYTDWDDVVLYLISQPRELGSL